MSARAALGPLALLLAASLARAEEVYVVDTLVVNVTSEAGPGGERVATVKSGDRLELIERDHEQSHVRLASGAEGWLRSSYLSSAQPAQTRLAERTAEVEKLTQDVSHLQTELAAARTAAASASQPPRLSEVAHPPQTGPTQDATDAREPAPETPTHEWRVIAATAGVTLLVGFALGWRTLDRRIRRRYGGLRIY